LPVPQVVAGQLDAVRSACEMAVALLAAAAVDSIILVGADTQTVRREPPFGGTFSPRGIDLSVGDAAADPLPLRLLVGAWLLARADGFVSVADPRAESFDRAAASAPAKPDADALLAIGRALAAELLDTWRTPPPVASWR
jgi:hypothetical protein